MKSKSGALEKTNSLLERVEALGKIGHWEIDFTSGQSFWSKNLYVILGLDPSSAIPSMDLLISCIHPEDVARTESQYFEALQSGNSFKIEKRLRHPNGDIKHVVSEGLVDLDESNNPLRLLGVIKDITEEKLKEEELTKTNLQLDNILKTTQDLIFIVDEEGYFKQTSKSCFQILGYTPEELIGKSFRDLVHPEDYEFTVESRKRILQGNPISGFQNRYIKKDGAVINLNWSATLDKDTRTVFAVARDVTQLLQTKKRLREDRQKLAIILDSSPETIWALDRDYKLLTANNRFIKAIKEIGNWEIQPGDNLIFGTPLPTEFIQDFKNHYDRAFTGESFSVKRKATHLKSEDYLQIHFKPIYDEDQIVAVGCYSLNITRQVEDEQRTQELLDRLHLAQKIGKLGYWELNIQTNKIYWSDEVYAIWGVDPNAFDPNFDEFLNTFHPDDKEEFFKHHTRAINGIAPLDAVHRIILPSGEIKWVFEKGELETDPKSGRINFRGTVQDITVEKNYEKQLIERNQFIETLLQHLPTGLAVNNIQTGEATYINPAFAEIYGWPADDIREISTFLEKIYPDPEFHAFISSQILSDIQSRDPERMVWKHIPIVTQNGEKRIITAKNIPLFDQNLMISTVMDDTDAYWADHSLRVSNERFHLAAQTVSDAIWDWDLTQNSIFWGKGYQRLFGYPADMENVSPSLWKEKIHPEDLPAIWTSIQKTRKDKTLQKWSGEYRFQKFDGTYTFVKENIIIIRDNKGTPTRMVGSLKDISLEKEKELELQKKTSLISAISHITQSFFETEEWDKLLPSSLQLMGETAGVDRVYFFKNFNDPDTGKAYTQQIFEWTNGQVSSEIDNPDYQAISLEDYPITLNEILRGRPFFINTKNSEGTLREILEEQNIKSIILMPIFVNDFFYGFIGFDDCTSDRTWSEDEISFLASVTTNLSLAIDRKENLDKIREALDTRDSLVESIGDSFYAIDTNYRVTYWNNVVEKLTGIKRELILGKNLWDFVEIVNEQFQSAYEIVFREQRTMNFETYDPWVKAWLEVTVYPSTGGLSVIIRDISQRKSSERQIQEFNERFRLISLASHDAIWDWNILTGEHYWGEGFNVLFGEDISGTHDNYDRWKDNIHPDDQDRIINLYLETLADPQKTFFEAEYRFVKKDGEVKYLLDKGTILRDKSGKATRVVGAIQDITSRKSYEESLKTLNSQLAQTNNKLETSNKELEQFAYVASHDLQEPLRMISSFLGLIQRKYSEVLDEKGHQYIHFAVDGARRMKEIILDLLEFSRLGNTTGLKVQTKTQDLIQEVLILNGKLIKEKRAIIHVGSLPDILCHPSQIIQVFQNLISNGLKYQSTDNVPEVWIEGEQLGSECRFSVRDNGIGIDPEYHDRIFIIFQRLHLKEQFSGSGIGLSLCKKIIEFHGGKIWVESSLGAGSTFYFTLKNK
ncbi:PAS domain-containing protein [Algoriphagus litoralis]|uniref:PAS domain-containing protein n=1 Tax=Algoriphagus litoralis TaxID=2202829 RepID=UPI0018E55EAF|nr:PAS domain-containing protein [Algoriphagus litoralis]